MSRPSFLQFEEARLNAPGAVGFPSIPMTPEVQEVKDGLRKQEQALKSQVETLRQQAQQLAQQNQPLREINKTLKEENELLKLRLSLFDVAPATPVFATLLRILQLRKIKVGWVQRPISLSGFEFPKNAGF